MIKHIVFDVGQVLLHWDPERAFVSIIPDVQERRWFLENVCSQSWNEQQDRGRSWREAENELIAQFPEHEARIKAYRANWHDMIPHSIDGSVEVLTKLIADGYDVTLLTNFAGDTFGEAAQRFPFLQLPRGATVSGRVGHLKPELAIYELHTESFDLEPQATLFIDDSPKNVEGAHRAGWQAVPFSDPEAMQADLARHGIAV